MGRALTVGTSTPAGAGGSVQLYWASRDRLRWLTVMGALGFAAAVTMAVAGLPTADLHGPLHHRGIMDPLCGGTRAARLTARGDLVGAWQYNPLGILAAFAALLAAIRLLVGVTTRRWLDVSVRWSPRWRNAVIALVVVGTVALEIRQQGRSELLMRPY